MINEWIIKNLITLPGLLIAITFHEFAHGYVAYLLGDNTAKNQGRLTLNPLKHIDIIGFVMLLTVGFGWAKPVPINSYNLKSRKRDSILISLAGSFTNFLIVIVATVLYALSEKFGLNEIISAILIILVRYNLILGAFNLLPFPPLDGSKVVASLLPTQYEVKFYEYERYLYLILIVLVFTGQINKMLSLWLNISYPLVDLIINTILN